MEDTYSDQITAVLHGFVEVWNRFEANLLKEMAQIQGNLFKISSRDQKPNFNYELFYRVCSTIYPKGNVTMGEFSSALSIPLSSATRIADWLVDHGYVQRIPDADDRRVVRITLTDVGKELFQAIDQYIRERVYQIMSGLTAQEITTLLNLVSKVKSGLKESVQ